MGSRWAVRPKLSSSATATATASYGYDAAQLAKLHVTIVEAVGGRGFQQGGRWSWRIGAARVHGGFMTSMTRPITAGGTERAGRTPVSVRLIRGATVLVEIGGLQLLTDLAFDPAGAEAQRRSCADQTAGPAMPATEIGPVDVVLLSRDRHGDILDRSGLVAAPRLDGADHSGSRRTARPGRDAAGRLVHQTLEKPHVGAMSWGCRA